MTIPAPAGIHLTLLNVYNRKKNNQGKQSKRVVA